MWFRFFSDDFVGGTLTMSNEEVGQYVRMLLAQWASGEKQAVPEEKISWLIRTALSPTVREKFVEVEIDGEKALSNLRMAAEYEGARAEFDAKSAGGRKTADKTLGKSPAKSPTKRATKKAPKSALPEPEPEPDTRTTAQKRQRSSRSASVPAPRWSGEACDDWEEVFGKATAPGSRIGKGLQRIVDRYGWEHIRPAWKRYLATEDPKFANPQDFASKLGKWLDKRVGKTKGEAFVEKTRDVLKEFLENH
jgi:uncharacterized protein YdaU (DUF1376 family)